MIFAAVSDVVWQALIAGVVTLVLAWMQHRASQKVEEVKDDLKASNEESGKRLDGLKQVADSTHILVNSSMSAQLKISMIALQRVAEYTKHPGDVAAANLAENLYRDHAGKQEQSDKQEAMRSEELVETHDKKQEAEDGLVEAVEELADSATVEESGEQIKDKIDEIS